jgi:endonuclease G
VTLPELPAGQIEASARRKDGDALTLDYVHFTVVQNAERRMPFLTAVNIDGKRARDVNRRTGEVEGGEVWFSDPRIPPEQQLSQDVFEQQRPRIFDRGHLVRRLDPAWGSAVTASRAASDTFHFTNCTLQVSAFNQRTVMWAGIENYVLKNAKADRKRVSVFSGPVFRSDDSAYRGVPVPREFWKVVVRREQDELRATAFLAGQGHLLSADLESFDELGEVAVFQTTVVAITQATGLDFGRLQDVDTRRTESAAGHEMTAFDQVEW